MTVRIKDLPNDSSPSAGDRIAVDGSSTRSTTIEDFLTTTGPDRKIVKASDFCEFDGVTDDTVGFLALTAAVNALDCAQIEFPVGATSIVWPTAAILLGTSTLMPFSGLTDLIINFNGSTIHSIFAGVSIPSATTAIGSFVITASTTGLGLAVGMSISGTGLPETGILISSFTASTITISVAATANGTVTLTAYPINNIVMALNNCTNTTINNYRVTSDIGKHAFTGFTHVNLINATVNTTLNGGLATGGSLGVAAIRGAGSATPRSRGIYTTLDFADVYYPGSFQFDGDSLRGTIRSNNSGRPYFPYNVDDHDVTVIPTNQTSQMIIACYATSASDKNSTQVKCHVIDVASTTGNVDPLSIEFKQYEATGATVPANIELDLTLDIDQTALAAAYNSIMTMSSYARSAGTIVLGDAAHTGNVVVHNTRVKGNTSVKFMDLGTSAQGFGASSKVNFVLRDVEALTMTRALNIGATARVRLENVNAPSSVLTADGALINDTLTGTALNMSGLQLSFYHTQASAPAIDNAWALGTASKRYSDVQTVKVNGLTVTPSTGTISLTNAKTLTVTNTMTFAGTDGTTITHQGTDTYVGRATTDTLTNKTFDSAGTGNVLQVSGVTVSRGQYPGINSNVVATAGNIGEVATSEVLLGSAVSISNNTSTNITSISLTAGQWLVYGMVQSAPAGGTTLSRQIVWTSATSASLPTIPNKGAYQDNLYVGLAAGNGVALSAGSQVLTLNSTTTVYLSTFITFSASTMTAYGFIGATRLR